MQIACLCVVRFEGKGGALGPQVTCQVYVMSLSHSLSAKLEIDLPYHLLQARLSLVRNENYVFSHKISAETIGKVT